MQSFNPFRISFDCPLGAQERTRARATATIVGGAAIFLGLSSLVTLLNVSSEAIGTWTNAKPPPEARIVATAAEDPSGKTCEEQTWPYLEARCLTSADGEGSQRSTPKHGLGSQQIALPAARQAPIAVVPEPGTTGVAAIDDKPEPVSAETTASTRPAAVPLPVPAPALSTAVQSGTARSGLERDAVQQRGEAKSRLSKARLSTREQRRLKRQERKMLQRERREEARRLRHERLRARHEARRDDGFFIFR